MIDFTMPSLGADMEAATLMAWKIAPGDTVHRGDVVAEVETDKGLIEIEVFHHGVVEELVAHIGQKLPVGAVLARLREAAPAPATATPSPPAAPPTTAPPAPIAAAPAPAPPADSPATSAASSTVPPAPAPTHTRVSPLARKVAATLGIDLATVTGSGPGGAIERADVERAAAQAAAASASPQAAGPASPATATTPAAAPDLSADHPDAATAMRRAIAAAVSKSNREIPHYHLATRIDMTRARAWLEVENARRPITDRLLPAAVLLAAVARALKDHPDLNAAWIGDSLVRRDAVHINFAIATRHGGLISPAVLDVQSKSVDAIMAALNDLIPRAKAGRLRSSELSEGTVTVTSLGDLGVETVFGVIYPPQVALIGFGRLSEEPWAENGGLFVRPVIHATLAGDHRATDGRTGARFLESLNRLLQHPESL